MFGDDNEGVDVLSLTCRSPGKKVQGGWGFQVSPMIEGKTGNSYFSG